MGRGRPSQERQITSPSTTGRFSNDVRKAEADVARAKVALAERDLENTIVRAPFDGKIVGLRTTVGKDVVPAETLFT